MVHNEGIEGYEREWTISDQQDFINYLQTLSFFPIRIFEEICAPNRFVRNHPLPELRHPTQVLPECDSPDSALKIGFTQSQGVMITYGANDLDVYSYFIGILPQLSEYGVSQIFYQFPITSFHDFKSIAEGDAGVLDTPAYNRLTKPLKQFCIDLITTAKTHGITVLPFAPNITDREKLPTSSKELLNLLMP